MMKVVRDGAGKVIAFGPADDNYEPSVAEGCVLSVEDYQPQPTLADIAVQFERAVQAELDANAVELGYDDILSACSYAGAPNPFQAEGKAFVLRRGTAWAYCYSELAKVESGARELPTIAQIISELPARVSKT